MSVAIAIVRSTRPGQWVKNVLVFAPLVFAQQALAPRAAGRTLAAFALFCLASGAVYLVNDLLDREQDRRTRSSGGGRSPRGNWRRRRRVTSVETAWLDNNGGGQGAWGQSKDSLKHSQWPYDFRAFDATWTAQNHSHLSFERFSSNLREYAFHRLKFAEDHLSSLLQELAPQHSWDRIRFDEVAFRTVPLDAVWR